MSTNFTLFFNYPNNLVRLVQEVNDRIGCTLIPYEGDEDDLFCRFFGMELSLSENEGFVNDGELNLVDYKYSIDIKVPSPDNDLLPVSLLSILQITYILHVRGVIDKSILVYDMQKLLARYRNDKKLGVINELTLKSIEFPEHLVDIHMIIE